MGLIGKVISMDREQRRKLINLFLDAYERLCVEHKMYLDGGVVVHNLEGCEKWEDFQDVISESSSIIYGNTLKENLI